MEGAALVEGRAGVTFRIELCVPWDAPEAMVDINSEGVVPLGSVPDVVRLFGRRPEAAKSWILQGRDPRSIRVLVYRLAGTGSELSRRHNCGHGCDAGVSCVHSGVVTAP